MKHWIQTEGELAHCAWCGSTRVRVIHLDRLGREFRRVVAEHFQECNPEDLGEHIEQLLQAHFLVFSTRIEEAHDDLMRRLALAVLESGVHPKHDVDLPDYSGEFEEQPNILLEEWQSRVEDAFQDSSRARLTQGTDLAASYNASFDFVYDQVAYAFEDWITRHSIGHVFYRARVHADRTRTKWFQKSELHAPPPELTPPGRGNRKGSPVLYVASDPATALAEVRPWVGAAVAVAGVKLLADVRVVDFTGNLPDVVSPFFNEGAAYRGRAGALLWHLAEDLSRPIGAHESDIFYRPTQLLCDLARSAGYDGICYRSSLGKGQNVLIFDPSKVEVDLVKYVRVSGIQHQGHTVREGDSPYDESPYDYQLSKLRTLEATESEYQI